MAEAGGSMNFSGDLEAKLIRNSGGSKPMPERSTYTPVKTNADLINDLCAKHGLTYIIKGEKERPRIEFTDDEGRITTGIGNSIREAISDAASRLGSG